MRYQSFACAFILIMRGSGNEREVLLHLRQNSGYMDEKWDASASGHLEPGESLQDCAVRETMEEIGIRLKPTDLHFVLLNHNYDENYIRAFFVAELPKDQTPKVCEPYKSGGLLWAKLGDLPENIVPFIPKVLECIKQQIHYDDGKFTNLTYFSGKSHK